MSRIEVTVVEARKLKDEDTVGGSNDPYIELWFDEDYKQKTSSQKSTNDPVWNEQFTFNLTGKHTLHLKAVDKDVGDTDKIGEGKIDLGGVVNGGSPVDTWVNLKGMIRSHGEVHIVARLV
ncbi:Synaptotagmin-7 [Borealophlyctis nickersoniae]|nr:Synaptotagmin-7 [Borealophlyctis nickersoniae]